VVDIAEGIGDFLHLLAVIEDGRVTLSHGMEFVAEEYGVLFLVGAEDALDGGPELTGGLIVALHGDVENRVVDGAKDPRADAAVCLVPNRVVGAPWKGAVNVQLEAEFAARRLEGGPFGEVGVRELQRNRDVHLHGHHCVRVDDDGRRKVWWKSAVGGLLQPGG
jgi:hypothetical protein